MLTLSKKIHFLPFIVFLMGAITLGAVYARKNMRKPPQKLTPFTITSRQTITPAGSNQTFVVQSRVRYQKSNGAWKVVSTFYNQDGSVNRIGSGFAQPGRGVFEVDEPNKKLVYLSAMPNELHEVTEASLRNDPKFLKEESVLGYNTFVLRFKDENGPGYKDIYYAPVLQGLEIKTVISDERATQVIEPLKIEIGEPSHSQFATLPNFPVTYEQFEKKIQIFEKAGKQNVTEQMRQELQRLKGSVVRQ